MNIKLNNKQINPSVINLRQYASTDTLVFTMDEYIYESHDLSKLNCYAVCDKGGWIDEVKLLTKVVQNKLEITWKVSGYTTQENGHINYQIMFKNDGGALWYSHKAIILVNSSINADDYIAANYPSILQQWEDRMDSVDEEIESSMDEVRNAVEITGKNAQQTILDASVAKNSATAASVIEQNIRHLVGYEPVRAVDLEVSQARGEYAFLADRLDAIEAEATAGLTTINREYFVASKNQRRYVLTKGVYTLGGNYLQVSVNGIQQTADILIEIDESTFELKSTFTVDAGDIIDVTYYLISASPNVETPSGAQKKVDVLASTVDAKFTNFYTKDESDSRYAPKLFQVETTISSASWQGTSAPFTCNVTVIPVTSNSVNLISLSKNATAAQAEAFANAIIHDNGQEEAIIKLKAFGEKPTVSLPISVVVLYA